MSVQYIYVISSQLLPELIFCKWFGWMLLEPVVNWSKKNTCQGGIFFACYE